MKGSDPFDYFIPQPDFGHRLRQSHYRDVAQPDHRPGIDRHAGPGQPVRPIGAVALLK